MHDVNDMDIETLRLHVEQARLHLRAIARLLPRAAPLTDEDRRCCLQIVDNPHADVFARLIEVMSLAPDAFRDLPWDEDNWVLEDDDDVAFMRDRLEGWRLLQPLADELGDVRQLVEDSAIGMGSFVRETLDGFAPGRALDLVETDPILREAFGNAGVYWKKQHPVRHFRPPQLNPPKRRP